LELVLLEAAVPESRRDCARGLRDVPDERDGDFRLCGRAADAVLDGAETVEPWAAASAKTMRSATERAWRALRR